VGDVVPPRVPSRLASFSKAATHALRFCVVDT
jgi:hypothetical protein